ncbi:uncharacterized protein LOC134194907 [Corticium candelabrum]|uniref:uncharacterized protein LOC134194907 n=1 Tax=Corticium candelabrum TaxID=121492 RepID=UPI002E264E11|nr:uncharacterized protein LOC134194907 [Corticium candelabrum]
MQFPENAISKIRFVKHVGFCSTEKHTFADSPVTGLDQILNKLEVLVKQKTAVGVEEIANDASVAGSTAAITNEYRQEWSAKESGKHEISRQSTLRLCEVVKGQVVVTRQLLIPLIAAFKSIKNRDNASESRWEQKLETCISGVIKVRIDSVKEWIRNELPRNECLNSYIVTSSLNRFKERCNIEIFDCLKGQWKLCSQICSQREKDCERCQRTCLKLAIECASNAKSVDCNCLEEDHRCREDCSQCLIAFGLQKERIKSLKTRCRLGARHKDKQHYCYRTEHPCPERCIKSMARCCLGNCAFRIENHPKFHLCSLGANHKCTKLCSAVECNNQCDMEFEHHLKQTHDLHFCGERQCAQKCSLSGCSRRCASKDHFHGLDRRHKHKHRCDKQRHYCYETCSVPGGRCFGRVEGLRNPCVVTIDDSGISHQGPHHCGQTHFCSNRCPCCGAFCSKPLVPVNHKLGYIDRFTKHKSICNTDAHQTAKRLAIVNSLGYDESSCEGDWCGNVCDRLGRGHCHLVECRKGQICTGHHVTNSKGVLIDLVRHDMFWKDYAHFSDPCKDKRKQILFSLCPAYCSSKAERELKPNSESFCKGQLWHHDYLDPVGNSGHVVEGHYFGCRHYKHIIVVVDCSESMARLPMNLTPEVIQAVNQTKCGQMSPNQLYQTLASMGPTRLNTVISVSIDFLTELKPSSQDCIISFISFSDTARLVVNSVGVETACQQLTTSNWTQMNEGGTQYLAAIRQLNLLINSHSYQFSMGRQYRHYEPAVFFLSDGETEEFGLGYEVSQLVAQHKATFSTCLFGSDSIEAQQVLTIMAESGRGKFYQAPTGAVLRANLHDFKACLYKTKAIGGY